MSDRGGRGGRGVGFRGGDRGHGGDRGGHSRRGGGGSGDGFSRGGGSFRGDGGGSFRGGGGGFRGRGGGGGRGGGVGTVASSTYALPHERQDNKNFSPMGWKPLPEKQDQITLPERNDSKPAVDHEKSVALKVNHMLTNITLPKNLYHYKVDIVRVKENKEDQPPPKQQAKAKPNKKGGGGSAEPGDEAAAVRKLPRDLLRRILSVLIPKVKNEFAKYSKKSLGIVTDFSAAVYTTERMEPTISLQYDVIEVEIEPEEQRQGIFRVEFSPTIEQIDTQGLGFDINQMKGRLATTNLLSIDRVYNTMWKNLENNRFTPVGRSSLICFDGAGSSLGGGILNFQGYSAIQGITNGWKPYLNVDIANCATLMNRNVLEVVADFISTFRQKYGPEDCGNIKDFPTSQIDDLSSLFRTMKVQYKPNAGKTLGGTVIKVSYKSVSQESFDMNGKIVTVYDYFRTQYRAQLKYKDGLCLILNGNKQVPAEICVIKKGQSYNRKLDGDQTTKMLDVARKDPQQLQDAIMKVVDDLRLQNNPILKDFGVQFADKIEMLRLNARVLAPPLLCYGKEPSGKTRARVTPDNGTWDIWRMNFEFQTPIPVKTWGLLLGCRAQDREINEFVGLLRRKSGKMGAPMTSEPIIEDCSNLRDTKQARELNVKVLSTSLTRLKKAECQFVLVVVPKKGCEMYSHIKQAAELSVGILTQCVALQNFAPKNPSRTESIVGNIILKINSKLGGINHTVVAPEKFASSFNIFKEPVIIIGADVTHPPPSVVKTDQVLASFAAVTASINKSGMPYMMHVQAQEKAGRGAAEVICNFKEIMIKILTKFRNDSKGAIPRKIIYFRDGVGEGQFPEVLHKEMKAMRDACTHLSKDYEPKITFITVQKRHKTRFFLQENNGVENAPPGTVVDVEIVHPTETDFYLLSHKGLLGTSRPTRYHLLWDDSEFSADEIQTLSYYLCYMYVRCNRSVKIPAPTYYSHWAAARAKILTEGFVGSIDKINKRLRREGSFENDFPMHFI